MSPVGAPDAESTTAPANATALAEDAAKFRVIFASAGYGILFADALTGALTDANNAAAAVLGYARDELRGRDLAAFAAEPGPAARADAAARLELARAGTPQLFEWPSKARDGRVFCAEITLRCITVGGRMIAMATLRDISERKREEAKRQKAAEDLRFANTLFKTQMDASPEGILVVDASSHILSFNHRFAELFRLPKNLVDAGDDEPVLAAGAARMKHPEAFLSRVRHYYRHPEEAGREEFETADGRHIDRITAPLRSSEGALLGRIWFFHDVTERRRAERVLAAASAEESRRTVELADAILRLEEAQAASARLLDDLERRRGELEREVAARERVERAQRKMLQRTHRQLDAVGAIGRSEALISGNVEAISREITELGAGVMGCERVNAWLFNEDETELRCVDLYEATPARHSAGMTLSERQFRAEFEIIKGSKYVDAHDALTDPRTAGYVESYLRPLGITSMLDAVIHVNGRNFGLLCFEHVQTEHRWEQDEIAFACQLADKIGLTIMNRIRRENEERIRTSETALAEAQALAHLGSWKLDVATGRITWSSETYRIFGLDPAHVQPSYEAFLARVHPDDRAAVDREYTRSVAERTMHSIDYRIVLDDGSIKWVHERGRTFYAEAGRPVRSVGTVHDITDRKRDEEIIRRMARFDGLTGLANRAVFAEAVQRAIAGTRRGGPDFAVLYLDLDHFKDVNDTLGHPIGDGLLKSIAERLRSNLRESDTVARFGGDEFAILQADLREPTDAGVLAAKLLELLRQPVVIDGNEIRPGGSIGIAVHGPEAPEAETLLAHADVALYRAKADGRGTYRFFTDAMDAEVRTRVTTLNDLRSALARDELFLLYQPQVQIATGRITGVEALVRWRHPRRGLLAPGEFIPIAENSGMIAPLGRWVLRAACRQARRWLDAGTAPERVAVNVSALQFKAPLDLERDIRAALEESRLPPQMLEIELTESAIMGTSRVHDEVLERLRRAGVKTAIDDFGTGYSSLLALRRFPVSRIKVAQDFVRDITTDPGDVAIVQATFGLARGLGLDVIAEGVETREQLALLESWGCEAAQGYYFAPPIGADEIAALLRRNHAAAGGAAPPGPSPSEPAAAA